MVEDVFLALLTAATAVFNALAVLLTVLTAFVTLETVLATAATAPATAPTTAPAAAAVVVFFFVVVDVFLVLLFLLPDELLELLDDEGEELPVPSYFAHCFIVSFTLQLIHVPLWAIVVSLTDASVSMS